MGCKPRNARNEEWHGQVELGTGTGIAHYTWYLAANDLWDIKWTLKKTRKYH